MTDPLDLAALEALAAAAQDGPWDTGPEADRDDHGICSVTVWDAAYNLLARCESRDPHGAEATARFVAASRTAVPALCQRVRELEAENAGLRHRVESVLSTCGQLEEDLARAQEYCEESCATRDALAERVRTLEAALREFVATTGEIADHLTTDNDEHDERIDRLRAAGAMAFVALAGEAGR